MPETVLLFHSNAAGRAAIGGFLRANGMRVIETDTPQETLRRAEARPVLCFAEVSSPERDAALIRELRKKTPSTPIIAIGPTALRAGAAVESGAFAYVAEPIDPDGLLALIQEALEQTEHSGSRRSRRLGNPLDSRLPELRAVLREAAAVAASRGNVLICGEPGTGRKTLARRVHAGSPNPGVLRFVDCARRESIFIEEETAGPCNGVAPVCGEPLDNGICLLGCELLGDGELACLARIGRGPVLRRLTDSTLVPVCYRIIAIGAPYDTSTAPAAFERLTMPPVAAVTLNLPALRQRVEDLSLSCDRLAQKCALKHGLAPLTFSEDALDVLAGYPWPGNFNELSALIDRLSLAHPGVTIEALMLPVEIHVGTWKRGMTYREAMEKLEREFLLRVLRRCGGCRRQAADRLKIPYSTLKYRLKKIGIDGRFK